MTEDETMIRRARRSAVLGAVLLVAVPACARQVADPVQIDRLRAHVYFLAADEMGGRAVGTDESRVAANYVASHFMGLGVNPAGDNGTYFQNFALTTGRLDERDTRLVARVGDVEHRFELGRELGYPQQSTRAAEVSGALVFAGYGVDAPEYGYNDFSSVDLSGKIAMVLTHEPQESDPGSPFKGKWHTMHAYSWYKFEQVRRAGAAGIVLVDERPHRPARVPGGPAGSHRASPLLVALPGALWDLPIFTITEEAANDLLRPSGRTIFELQEQIDRTGRPASFEVPDTTVSMRKALEGGEPIQARNVVGLLEGSDPELRDEFVVITAHYDHVGVVDGRVHPGADDNATGTAAVLEIAEAYARGGLRPRRSLLFVLFDAEEHGLLGAFHYVAHPVVPISKTVADLNIDMIGRDEDSPTWMPAAADNRNRVNVVGTLYSPDLRRAIESGNSAIGLELDYKTDADDREAWFSRSDHFAFATKSVPQVLFNTGEHGDYHTEHDTWDRVNFSKMARIVRLALATSAELADGNERPRFTP